MDREKTTYLSIFRLGKRTLILLAVLGLVIAVVFSAFQPLQYSSQASVLVIPNPRMNLDGYQATKSAEKYALTLSSVVESMSFYNKVSAKNPEISSLFPKEESKQIKEWKRDMNASVVPETGILRLSVYNREKEDAQAVLNTAMSVLEEEGPAYLGGNSAVLIYMIDSPIASSMPVRPNYPLNLLGGIIAGLLVGAVVVFARTEVAPAAEPEPERVEQPIWKPAVEDQDEEELDKRPAPDEKPRFVFPAVNNNQKTKEEAPHTRPITRVSQTDSNKRLPEQEAFPEKTEMRARGNPAPVTVPASQEPWITVTKQNKNLI